MVPILQNDDGDDDDEDDDYAEDDDDYDEDDDDDDDDHDGAYKALRGGCSGCSFLQRLNVACTANKMLSLSCWVIFIVIIVTGPRC